MSDLISRNAVLDRYYVEWGKQDISIITSQNERR